MYKIQKISGNKNLSIPDGVPVIISSDDGVMLEAASYIAENCLWGGRPVGSVSDDAYILKSWLNFLLQRSLKWDCARELDVIAFIAQSEASGHSRVRVARRASVVIRWYFFLARRKIGGDRIASLAASLSDNPLELNQATVNSRLKAPRGPKSAKGRRNVPGMEDVGAVLDQLALHEDPFIAERNFTLASVVAGTGLRAIGVHGLTIGFFDNLLGSNGLLAHSSGIEKAAFDKELRDSIRLSLHQWDRSGRGSLAGPVKEKRGYIRQVRFPVPIVLLVLSHAWGERNRMLHRLGVAARAPLWLSSERGMGISLGHVKDILAKGFNDAHIDGSGHSLRAHFLTQMALALLHQARERDGGSYDVPSILTQLAILAGHASTDSLQFYLDEAVIMASMLNSQSN